MITHQYDLVFLKLMEWHVVMTLMDSRVAETLMEWHIAVHTVRTSTAASMTSCSLTCFYMPLAVHGCRCLLLTLHSRLMWADEHNGFGELRSTAFNFFISHFKDVRRNKEELALLLSRRPDLVLDVMMVL